jgi:deoxyribodipyrimidine photo-lyase
MTHTTILWFRRDLRLCDHAALTAAARNGPVIPIFIKDRLVDKLGAAPKLRLKMGLQSLSRSLQTMQNRLIFREGDALEAIQSLLQETGAGAVYWSRLYDLGSVRRDKKIKSELTKQGVQAKSFGGHLLFEPRSITTKAGGFYKVYTPFWNNVRDLDVEAPLPAPPKLVPPAAWPRSDALENWQLDKPMNRGAAIVGSFITAGETAAQERLAKFLQSKIANYGKLRDRPDMEATSGLSEYLALGEISPHQCWHPVLQELQKGDVGAELFAKELVWREFAYHLLYHTPQIADENWKSGWDSFPWNKETTAEVIAWQQGRTGIPFVDAAMRELYVSGRMHNRARMIVASYLTKHLLSHWKIGLKWFEDCLIDWDPASNAMGWQWVAGSGPDAAPYFRIYNPVTQLAKFDPSRVYVDRWIAEGKQNPHPDALKFFEAILKSWPISPSDPYPAPAISVEEGRRRALATYEGSL